MTYSIKRYDDFRKWNEEMGIKYNPDSFHNSSNIFIRWIEGKRVHAIIKESFFYKEKKILEVGCGAGNILDKVLCSRSYGMDLSGFLIKKAKIRLHNKSCLVLGNGEKMPFKSGSFDMVICTEVIEHTENPEVLLESIFNILKTGGCLVISIPNEKIINFLKTIYFKCFFVLKYFDSNKNFKYQIAKKMDDEWHLHEFKIASFVQLLEKNFELKRIYRIPYYFLPVRHVISCSKKHK